MMGWPTKQKTKAILICGIAFVLIVGIYVFSKYQVTHSAQRNNSQVNSQITSDVRSVDVIGSSEVIVLSMATSSTSLTTSAKDIGLSQDSVQINGVVFKTDAVYTEATRERGLSGRKKLGSNESMLFVFPTSAIYGFWMKDMNFSLDIIWADEEGRIVYLVEHATPQSYPKAFVPNLPGRLVLEVNDGTIAAKKIKIGDKLHFDKNILKKATN